MNNYKISDLKDDIMESRKFSSITKIDLDNIMDLNDDCLDNILEENSID